MNENLLQYLWNYKLFTSLNFHDRSGEALEILDFGKWNRDAGPDFLMAKIRWKGMTFVGPIELHIKASDWILHGHDEDLNYQHIILHAVYFDDAEIPSLENRGIPTLVLAPYIDLTKLHKFEQLAAEETFIPCEKIFTPAAIPFGFSEETLLQKLAAKATAMEASLNQNKNNWEALLFQQLAYAFGLKVNAETFLSLAESLDFSVVQKIRQNLVQMEALLLGRAGWLGEPRDEMMALWQREFQFLKNKFQLDDRTFPPKFLRLRPPGFPTLRLSQLASLYHRHQGLFATMIAAESLAELSQPFASVCASEYWNTHYNFGKTTKESHPKKLSEEFIRLLLINAVLPVKYAYHRNLAEDAADRVLALYEEMPPEENSLLKKWRKVGAPILSALDSQAFLHHHRTHCSVKKCLHCGIGLKILKAHA